MILQPIKEQASLRRRIQKYHTTIISYKKKKRIKKSHFLVGNEVNKLVLSFGAMTSWSQVILSDLLSHKPLVQKSRSLELWKNQPSHEHQLRRIPYCQPKITKVIFYYFFIFYTINFISEDM